jgi:peptidoglycan/xylan/chitin deacetylase (PgdA/CDA1 family)
MAAASSTSATPQVTLTFDNGPTPGVTEEVLDVLAGRGLRATFFVVGTCLRQTGGRELARRAASGGHWVGHHTTTHRVLLGSAVDAQGAVQAEIADLAAEMKEFDGATKLFRPYAAGGVLDRQVFSEAAVRYLQEHGYTCVLWNSVPHDWDDPVGWVDRALADVLAQPWTVLVLHDIASGAMAQLPRFLDELKRRGATVVQDFPESCLPIVAGQVQQPLSHLTMETTA